MGAKAKFQIFRVEIDETSHVGPFPVVAEEMVGSASTLDIARERAWRRHEDDPDFPHTHFHVRRASDGRLMGETYDAGLVRVDEKRRV